MDCGSYCFIFTFFHFIYSITLSSSVGLAFGTIAGIGLDEKDKKEKL
jgi:hypothetical protein